MVLQSSSPPVPQSSDISVVIPTFNAETFIQGALDSVFAQTLLPHEIIVVDDCSKDNTTSLVDKIAAHAPIPIRLVRMPSNTGGPPVPINTGIRAASGSLIALLEQDDRMLPQRLAEQVKCLAMDSRIGLVFSKCQCVTKDGEEESLVLNAMAPGIAPEPGMTPFFRIPSLNAYESLITCMYALTCSSFLFSLATWEACGGFDEDIPSCCDHAFLQKVARQYDVGFIDAALTVWHRHHDSLYRSSARASKHQDQLRVLYRFDTGYVGEQVRTALKRRIRDEALSAAFFCRQAGDSRSALRHYVTSITRGRVSVESLRGLASLCVPGRSSARR